MKTQRVTVRFTESDLRQIDKAASLCCLDRSVYIRSIALRDAMKRIRFFSEVDKGPK